MIATISATNPCAYGEKFDNRRYISATFNDFKESVDKIEKDQWYGSKIVIHELIGVTYEELQEFADWLQDHEYTFNEF